MATGSTVAPTSLPGVCSPTSCSPASSPWPDPSDPVQYVLEMMASEPKKIRELAPEVPEHLEQAVHRALSKEPSARFAAMSELLAALGLGMMRPREMSLPPSDSSAGVNRLVVSTPNLDVAASLVRQSLTSAPNLAGSTPVSVPTGTPTGSGARPSATRTTVLVSTVVVVAVAVAAVMFRAYF